MLLLTLPAASLHSMALFRQSYPGKAHSNGALAQDRHSRRPSAACRWVPKATLSQALSVAYSGGPVGIIVALLAAPAIIRTLGWESVFWIFGTTGLLWIFAWMPLVDEEPPQLLEDAKKDRPAAKGAQAFEHTHACLHAGYGTTT